MCAPLSLGQRVPCYFVVHCACVALCVRVGCIAGKVRVSWCVCCICCHACGRACVHDAADLLHILTPTVVTAFPHTYGDLTFTVRLPGRIRKVLWTHPMLHNTYLL